MLHVHATKVGDKIMTDGTFQLQIDSNLAQRAADIFSHIGLDLQSAVQLFLSRSVQVRGIPFAMRLPDNRNTSSNEAIEAMKNMSRMAEEAGIADMKLDEINAEIDAVRRGNAEAHEISATFQSGRTY